MVPPLFDPAQIKRAAARCAPRFTQHDFLIARAWHDIFDRLMDIRAPFEIALILGTRGSAVAQQTLTANGKVTGPITLHTEDPSALIPLYGPGAFDLVLSVFDLHKVDDVAGALIQIRHLLKPNGVFLGVFPGDETLQDLRTALMRADLDCYGGASPRVHPMITRQQASDLMQRAGFALPVVDAHRLQVDYADFLTLLYDLRYMGEGNALTARRKSADTRAFFSKAEEFYRAKTGEITAQFDIIHLIGWAAG